MSNVLEDAVIVANHETYPNALTKSIPTPVNRRSLIIIVALVVMGTAALLLIRRYANSEARLLATTDKDLAAAAAKLGAGEPFAPPAFQAIAASHRLRLAIGSLGLGDEPQNQNVATLVLAELHEAPGFVGLVDFEENTIKRIAYLPARSVEQIQLAGGGSGFDATGTFIGAPCKLFIRGMLTAANAFI